MKRIDSTYYLITEDGKVWSEKTKKFLKFGLSNRGYPHYGLIICKKVKTFTVHRLVAKYYVDNPNNYSQVNHIDGNKLNNHFTNLEWCSQKQNNQHAYDIGLREVGSKHHKAKLTEEQVKEIRHLYSLGTFSHRKLGRMFDMDKSVIGDIVNRNTWKSVK